MKQLHKGQFYGQINETLYLDGLTLTDTEYTHNKVDWHYHEMPYFTFLLQGGLMEGNKKDVYHCSAGDLLFHNWQEAHYNIKPKGFARGFHIELDKKWISQFDLDLKKIQGSIQITDPDIKFLLYKIFRETKIHDNTTSISIQNLLLETFVGMENKRNMHSKGKPAWVSKINEILYDHNVNGLSLSQLSDMLDIHPVHLSRDFSKYFHCNLGEYIRKLKVEKSLSLLSINGYSLMDITFACGFYDQSHFIRCFKEIIGTSPLAYRKILLD